MYTSSNPIVLFSSSYIDFKIDKASFDFNEMLGESNHKSLHECKALDFSE